MTARWEIIRGPDNPPAFYVRLVTGEGEELKVVFRQHHRWASEHLARASIARVAELVAAAAPAGEPVEEAPPATVRRQEAWRQ